MKSSQVAAEHPGNPWGLLLEGRARAHVPWHAACSPGLTSREKKSPTGVTVVPETSIGSVTGDWEAIFSMMPHSFLNP